MTIDPFHVRQLQSSGPTPNSIWTTWCCPTSRSGSGVVPSTVSTGALARDAGVLHPTGAVTRTGTRCRSATPVRPTTGRRPGSSSGSSRARQATTTPGRRRGSRTKARSSAVPVDTGQRAPRPSAPTEPRSGHARSIVDRSVKLTSTMHRSRRASARSRARLRAPRAVRTPPAASAGYSGDASSSRRGRGGGWSRDRHARWPVPACRLRRERQPGDRAADGRPPVVGDPRPTGAGPGSRHGLRGRPGARWARRRRCRPSSSPW